MTEGFAGALADALETSWPAQARPNQLPPQGDWNVWLLLAGRGYGKTRVLSEWASSQAISGRTSRLAIVGATAADVRDIMIEGKSGILACAPAWASPTYKIIAPTSDVAQWGYRDTLQRGRAGPLAGPAA